MLTNITINCHLMSDEFTVGYSCQLNYTEKKHIIYEKTNCFSEKSIKNIWEGVHGFNEMSVQYWVFSIQRMAIKISNVFEKYKSLNGKPVKQNMNTNKQKVKLKPKIMFSSQIYI